MAGGGSQSVQSGGVASGTVVLSGGTEGVYGTGTNETISGTETVYSGGGVFNNTVGSGGSLTVQNGGVASGTTVQAGGTEGVYGTGTNETISGAETV